MSIIAEAGTGEEGEGPRAQYFLGARELSGRGFRLIPEAGAFGPRERGGVGGEALQRQILAGLRSQRTALL